MATTFHVANFKNKTLDLFTGVSSTVTPLGYVQLYNGVQPADPATSPVGTAVFSSISSGSNLNTKMSASSGGISQLSANVPPTTPSNAAAVSGLTFARIWNSGASVPLIDTPVSLVGGGGGLLLDNLTSTVGVGPTVTGFSLKLPNSLGTLLLGAALQNRLVDMWVSSGMTPPGFGSNTTGACSITLHSGAVPSTADAAPGPIVATYNMSATNLWAAAVGGAAALAAAGPTVTASGSGTATYFRMTKTLGAFTFVFQGTVGTVSGASDMILNTTALTSGVTSVQITDFTISM